MRISDWSSDVCSSDLAAGGKAETITADVVLVSIGRKPNTDGLALEKAGLSTNKRGQIEIDHDFATAIPGIWAIGDVVPGPMLAHKRSEEHTSELQSLMRISYAVFCLKKKKTKTIKQ